MGAQDETSQHDPKNKQALQKKYAEYSSAWRTRKSRFSTVWEQMTENMDKNPKSLMEEIGIETDEGAGETLAKVEAMVKRPRAA